MVVYLELTQRFNEGRLRAVISSGQAVVLHRLAIMSKDGDWIIREDAEATSHIQRVLTGYGALYRFGAPLDPRWLTHGWSSHFQFRRGDLRVRTDFVSRPPRLSPHELAELWEEQAGRDPPFVSVKHLVAIKQTNREKDYVVIGELARLMPDPRDQLLYSRSARDMMGLAARHPNLIQELSPQRPLLQQISAGRDRLEAALDAERRAMIRANEERLRQYTEAARAWAQLWPAVARETAGLPLPEAHEIIVSRADGVLPFEPPGDSES